MKKVTVVIPTIDDSGAIGGPARITAITNVGGAVVTAVTKVVGLPGAQGEKGDTGERGPGILSNITRITVSTDPPANPEVNDLWIDLT